MRPNLDIIRSWVHALRSGAYHQGHCAFRADGRHCALGVLCDLHARATGGHWDADCYLGCSGFLPPQVQAWAGLSSEDPEISGVPMSVMNDGTGEHFMSFADIAAAIEQYYDLAIEVAQVG